MKHSILVALILNRGKIMQDSAREIIIQGSHKLQLKLEDYLIDKLLAYLQLLLKWNKVFSLTAITETKRMITHHLLDGLTVINYIKSYKNIIDVGSGMGVPGVIIAICCPEIQVSAIDISHKKTAFLQQVAIELKLNNLHVFNLPVEKFTPEFKFDLAISRAFADSILFMNLTRHLFENHFTAIAMKSQGVINEVARIEKLKNISYELIPVKIPNVNDERYLLKIEEEL